MSHAEAEFLDDFPEEDGFPEEDDFLSLSDEEQLEESSWGLSLRPEVLGSSSYEYSLYCTYFAPAFQEIVKKDLLPPEIAQLSCHFDFPRVVVQYSERSSEYVNKVELFFAFGVLATTPFYIEKVVGMFEHKIRAVIEKIPIFVSNYLYLLLMELAKFYQRKGRYCIVCEKELPIEMPKVSVCDNALCLFGSELFGFGVDLNLDQRVSNLLLDFAYSAANSRRLEPYPTALFGPGEEIEICRLLRSIPDDYKVEDFMIHRLAVPPTEEQKLRINLFRWVLATNRSHITYVDGVKPYFAITANPPEKEAVFQGLKRKYGSQNIYHGSPLFNWHSIVRIGLKNYSGTKNMANGAAFGPGIYCSADYAVSSQYAGSYMPCKSAGRNGNPLSIVAAVEIISVPASAGQVAYPNGRCPHYRILDDNYISIRQFIIR